MSEQNLRSPKWEEYVNILTGNTVDKTTKKETEKKVRKNLNQLLLKFLRVEKLENKSKMKVDIEISNLNFLIRGYGSDGKLLFVLDYTPHILDPLGTSYKWYSHNKDCISDGALHTIAHSLYLHRFHEVPNKYHFKLKLPTLTKTELEKYNERFIDL